MPVELQTALISAIVALITALLGGYLTWSQIQRERKRWLIDLKASYETERYKIRLASYPKAFEIIARLSHGSPEPITPEKARQVSYELNEWFYSTGGMCAEADTRGAILELRRLCMAWGQQGVEPDHLYDWRNVAMLLLRRDLDLQGLESTNIEGIKPLLKKLQADIALLQ